MAHYHRLTGAPIDEKAMIEIEQRIERAISDWFWEELLLQKGLE
jgi:hypothetical protein